MKIKTKLFVLVLIASVLLVVTSAVAVLSLWNEGQTRDQIVSEGIEPLDTEVARIDTLNKKIQLLLNADRDIYQALKAEKDMLSATSAEQREQFTADHVENLDQTIERISEAARDIPELDQKLSEFKTDFATWRTTSEGIVDKASNPRGLTFARRKSGTSNEQFAVARDMIDQMQGILDTMIVNETTALKDRNLKIQDDAKVAYQVSQAIMVCFIITAVVCIAVLLALGFVLSRMIVNPLKQMIVRMHDIADGEGDLTQRVNVKGKDELAELGNLINRFIGQLHDIIHNIRTVGTDIDHASTELSQISEQMSQNMSRQSQQSEQIAAAIHELNATVREVADKATNAADSANNAGERANDGSTVLQSTVTHIHRMSDNASEVSQLIEQLDDHSKRIGDVITVINDIADQTNLLALNAAIEAARAGEHGRGFSVVADEVRKLAERTSVATGEVSSAINEIQSQTLQAVDRVNSGNEEITRSVDMASKTSETFETIVEGSQSLAGMIDSIAAATEEQSASAEQISQSVSHMQHDMQEASQGANQTSNSSVRLRDHAQKLNEMINRFKLN